MSNLPPNTELVAVAWVRTITGVPAQYVATTVPELTDPNDNTSWAASGFIQVGPVVGGSPEMYVPMRKPVVQITCWAVAPTGRRPPWGQANYLAELVVAGCYDSTAHRTISMVPSGYQQALVHDAYATEPRRVPGDQGNYGRYTFDLFLDWTVVPS